MPDLQEDVHVSDKVEAQVTPGQKPVLARVKVLAEAGIFKNGRQYDEGSEAVITLHAAQNFERVKEVEILEVNVKAPEAEDE